MDDVFTYLVDLPDQVNELVCPCADGYTIWIDARLDAAHREKAYLHALGHIRMDDFQKTNVQEVECKAHKKEEL